MQLESTMKYTMKDQCMKSTELIRHILSGRNIC